TNTLRGPSARKIAPAVRLATCSAINQWPRKQSFSVRSSVHCLCLEVMLQIIFGSDDADISGEALSLFRSDVYRVLGSWGPWSRLAKLTPAVRDVISVSIKRRRSLVPTSNASLLDCMLSAHDDSGQPIGAEEIQDQILTLLVAGVDPVAIGI